MGVNRQPCCVEKVSLYLIRQIARVLAASILLGKHRRAGLAAKGRPRTIEIVPHHRSRRAGKLISEWRAVLHLVCRNVDDEPLLFLLCDPAQVAFDVEAREVAYTHRTQKEDLNSNGRLH